MRAEDLDGPIRVALEERAACPARGLGVDVEVARPGRLGTLHRVMHQVAGDDGVLALRADAHAHVPGRVARRRLQPDLVAQAMIGLDEVREARVEDGPDGVAEDFAVRVVPRRAPVRPLRPAKEIARPGEGRDPAAVDQHRVPADVIDVEMGADDEVERLARETRPREVLEKRTVELVPERVRPGLVVADAGVDDDRVHRGEEPSLGVGEARPEPTGMGLEALGRRLPEEEGRRHGSLHLDHAGDPHVADRPGLHRSDR